MKIAICGVKELLCNGGVERGVEELNSRLLYFGVEVIVFCRGERHREFIHRGLLIRSFPYLHNKYLCYFSYMAYVFLDLLRSHDFDLIHIHSPCVNGIWVLLLKIAGFKVISHSHGEEWKASKWPYWFKLIMYLSNKIAAIFSNAIICINKEELRYYNSLNYHQNTQIVYLPNGISKNKRECNDDTLKQYDLKEGMFFLYAGRFVPQKRVHDLIAAFKYYKGKKKLVLSGMDSYTKKYTEYTKQLAINDKRIIFTGGLSFFRLQTLYANCFSFILPSDHEGCPNSLLEAISYKCVCVVTSIGSINEIAQGLLPSYNPGDIAKLSFLIDRLDNDALYYTQIKDNVIKILSSWPDWNNIATGVFYLYTNIINQHLAKTNIH